MMLGSEVEILKADSRRSLSVPRVFAFSGSEQNRSWLRIYLEQDLRDQYLQRNIYVGFAISISAADRDDQSITESLHASRPRSGQSMATGFALR